MSYAIIRNANYKKDNLAGLYKHNERKNSNYSNKDINKNMFRENFSLKNPQTTYTNFLKKLQESYNLQGRIIKTTNVMCEFIITSNKDFFERIGINETKRYFQVAYKFVANYQNLGEEFIVSAKVHLDETTPHMHIVFVPVIHKLDKKSGKQINKLACSEYWKGKDSYRRLQDNFYSYMIKSGFDLERGNAKENTHIPIETLKSITEYENIKYEQTQTPVKEIKTNDIKELQLQNKKLVKYANSLRGYYIKSQNAIEKCIKLEQENYNLKFENKEFKDKNQKLTNYINKVFEVVNLMFDFPVSRLKSIINKFIGSINK